MMLPTRDWLYMLADEEYRTYSVSPGGAVVKNSQVTFLPQSPIGYEDTEIGYGTNDKYFSLFRSYTPPMEFINDGAKIIRHCQYNGKGYEEKLYLLICRWNRNTGIYQLEYRGRINMSMNKDRKNGVQVNTIEGGVLDYITSNAGTSYPVPCDETNAAAIKVLFDGVTLKDTFNIDILKDIDATGLAGALAVPTAVINNEGDSVGVIVGSQNLEPVATATSSNYLFSSVAPITVSLTGTISVKNHPSLNPAAFRLWLATSLTQYPSVGPQTHSVGIVGGTNGPNQTWSLSPHYELSGEQTFTFNVNFDLDANEKLFLLWFNNDASRPTTITGGSFKVSFLSKALPSTAFALRPLDLLKGLFLKMTDGKYTADSMFYRTRNNIVATCGDAIRNVDRSVVPNYFINTSFDDFFQSYNAWHNLCIRRIVDNVVWIEPKGDTYEDDDTSIMDLGEIEDPVIQFTTQFLINRVKTGFPNQNYDQRAGKYEFNTTTEWRLPVTTIEKELNLVSKYRGDCLGIEIIRASLTKKDTTDDSGDKEVFVVNISDEQDPNFDNAYKLKRAAYDQITGVLDNTVFNAEELTPARQARAHGNYLASLMWQFPGEYLYFQKSDKNDQLATLLGTEYIAENANIPRAVLGNPLFLNYLLSFRTRIPYTYSTILKYFGKGHIKASYNGYPLYFLPIGDMTNKPVTDEAQEWQLVLSPKTSIATLSKLFTTGLFVTDYNNNTMQGSSYNPLHIVRYNYQLNPKYHEKDIWDDWFKNTIDSYNVSDDYIQKFQNTDAINLQFITAGMESLQVRVYGEDGFPYLLPIPADIITDPAVQLPYILQQFSIDLSEFDEGKYLFVFYSNNVPLAISEWVHVAQDWPGTFLFEYYNSFNKLDGYFSQWRPMIRLEASWTRWMADSTFTDFVDENGNGEALSSRTNKKRTLYLGDEYGIPHSYMLLMDEVFMLNNVSVEGQLYKRIAGANIEELELAEGNPMCGYSLEVTQQINRKGLHINDVNIPGRDRVAAYTFDTEIIGQPGGGVFQVEFTED